ncbi:MAG: flavodoxin family protein [Rhizobiales bacterium]|nr:flavodoxin family protein [Hyphomicrobiales bacterium]
MQRLALPAAKQGFPADGNGVRTIARRGIGAAVGRGRLECRKLSGRAHFDDLAQPLTAIKDAGAGSVHIARGVARSMGARAKDGVMAKRVLIIQGHPDCGTPHYCHALAEAYRSGATGAGAEVEHVDIARLAPEPLLSEAAFATPPDEAMRAVQQQVLRAEHLVVVFPLWLGTMPALVKAFFEQLARADFAVSERGGGWPKQNLAGRSARVIVTMGMPALAFRFLFGAAGVRCLRNGVLSMSGVGPVRETYIGGIGALDERQRARWLERVADLGRHQR